MTRPNADLDHLDKNGRSIAVGDCVRWHIDENGERYWHEANVVRFEPHMTEQGEPYDMVITNDGWSLFAWDIEAVDPRKPRDVMP